MRMSTVFELLLICLLIAFAAYGRVIDRDEVTLHRIVRSTKPNNFGVSIMSLKQATENVNKYCTCNENICNCCRNFHIPVVKLQGPGCASLQYLKEDNLAVQLSFGDNILTSTVISGKKPRAICVPMPGGLTKFCGRIYSIEREADNHFKACLGLELQSASELEASLRVSCFRFGPEGLQLRPAEQLPVIEPLVKPDSDEDDDFDYDIFDLDDDTPDSDEDTPVKNTQTAPVATQTADDDDDDDDDDVLGFGALLDIITGDDESDKKKTTTAPPILPFTIPMITKTTTIAPAAAAPISSESMNTLNNKTPIETKKPTKVPKIPNTETVSAISTESSDIESTEQSVKVDAIESSDDNEETTAEEMDSTEASTDENSADDAIEDTTATDSTMEEKPSDTNAQESSAAASSVISTVSNSTKISTVKKIIGIRTVKKPSVTSTSVNAISSDIKKPHLKPTKPDPLIEDSEENEDYSLASDLEEDEYTENIDNESAEIETEDDDYDEDEDESEEEEDAVLTALVSDDDKEKTKDEKISDNEAYKPEEDDADYGVGLAELLARKRRMRSGRQSKVMRL